MIRLVVVYRGLGGSKIGSGCVVYGAAGQLDGVRCEQV